MGPARPPRPDGDDAQLKQVRRPRRRNGVVGVVIVVAFAVVAGALISDRGPTRRRARPAATSGEATEVAPASAGPVTGKDLVGGMTAPWIVAENAMPGTDAWKLTGNLTDGAIEGYADQVSVDQGGSFKLFVSTTAKSFHVEAYRMGYYGGRGGRFIWKSPDLPGVKQPAATVSPRTNMVVAPWQSSLSVPTDKTWPPGSYLLKLVGATGEAHHVPITVRDDASTATYLLQNSVTTWQAYNAWGGYDLYSGRAGKGTSFANRAKEVSFDRPYEMNYGSGDFMGNEFPLISLVESLGLDVTYWTDVDLDAHPEMALHHKAIISLGHDEYYSSAMRAGLQQARDAGVNVAFLGANAVYRHIRLTSSPLGAGRQEIDYKSASARQDPLYGKDNSEVTSEWRDGPDPRPESSLVGGYYQCNPVKYDMVIAEPDSWLWQGTGLKGGDHLTGLVGSEYDRYAKAAPAPPAPVEVLAHSPVVCGGHGDYSDVTYYSAPGGAGVFDSGTSAWVPAMSWPCATQGACVRDSVVRATENLFRLFGQGPAGQQQSSTANIGQLSAVVPTAPPKTTTTTGRSPHGSVTTRPASTATAPAEHRSATSSQPHQTTTTTR